MFAKETPLCRNPFCPLAKSLQEYIFFIKLTSRGATHGVCWRQSQNCIRWNYGAQSKREGKSWEKKRRRQTRARHIFKSRICPTLPNRQGNLGWLSCALSSRTHVYADQIRVLLKIFIQCTASKRSRAPAVCCCMTRPPTRYRARTNNVSSFTVETSGKWWIAHFAFCRYTSTGKILEFVFWH